MSFEMAEKTANDVQATEVPRLQQSNSFEQLVRCAPIFDSLLLQLPTDSLLALYHTSHVLRHFLRTEPTSWKYLSFRLFQPAVVTSTPNNANGNAFRPSSNYSLDQLFVFVVCPFSTCLTSLELDNTAVCGMVLSQTVLTLRRETLEHLSVRGCKNVSLKYHINPWLMMVKLTSFAVEGTDAPLQYQKLALKSLYTYRCRHHRRRPYLPNSLMRKDSDSEPTHQLVEICHKLGIWTDTAWCTTPGGRCLRRRGYVTMRVPQDPREVWVVYDRLWRSRNWIGTVVQTQPAACTSPPRKRKRDCRSWELEEAVRGEALGTGKEGKGLPAHMRKTHKQFVGDINCDNCSTAILERCEQCSVTMHCSGCRKTLCASCAFDRPYLRNKNAPDEDKNSFWWAPGSAVSPCAMQDTDPTPAAPGAVLNQTINRTELPNLRFKWCCTEPVFSGGGGITFGPGSCHDHDQIRAAPLMKECGWEDQEFSVDIKSPPTEAHGPGGRWKSIDGLLRRDELDAGDYFPTSVHRVLCDDCYASDHWNLPCKGCAVPVCLKHDVQDKLRARICGYKDLVTEKQDFRARQKVVKLKLTGDERTQDESSNSQAPSKIIRKSKETQRTSDPPSMETSTEMNVGADDEAPRTPLRSIRTNENASEPESSSNTPESLFSTEASPAPIEDDTPFRPETPAPIEDDTPVRPETPGSDGTATPSRSSSPTPSSSSASTGSEIPPAEGRSQNVKDLPPDWNGCQSMFCPQSRGPGDHRRRCVAVIGQCWDCKVNVCGDCVASIGPGCPCTGCRRASSDDGGISSVTDGARFFCPNCRWQRRQDGTCKRRVASLGPTKKRRDKYRKPVAERTTSTGASSTDRSSLGYEDATVEMMGEFLECLNLHSTSPQTKELDVMPEETTEEIQALEDVGVLARDLILRIQRLRQQFRPGSLHAAALPVIRVEEAGNVMVGPVAAPAPIVEDMD